MGTATKRLGTDLAELLEKHGPRTLRSELAALVEAQGVSGHVRRNVLQSLLDRYPAEPITSGCPPLTDRAHALRVLRDLALWARPLDKVRDIAEAIETATALRHPSSDTGNLRMYLRLLEVEVFLAGGGA